MPILVELVRQQGGGRGEMLMETLGLVRALFQKMF